MTSRPWGVGLGLRAELADELLELRPRLGFVEVSPENHIGRGGRDEVALERAAALWPVVTHGLTMSLGGTEPLRRGYLADLRAFVAKVGSPWHSDHLCFTSHAGVVLHELLPIAFHEREVMRIADRIKEAEDALGCPMAIENVSMYAHPGRADMGEAEFLARLCEAADCRLLLDVNNAYVNATNHGFDVDTWMATVPVERVVQIHVAGHAWFEDGGDFAPAEVPRSREGRAGKLIVDTHGEDVAADVLALLERVLRRTGPVPVLLERDRSFPPLTDLLGEVRRLEALWERATGARVA